MKPMLHKILCINLCVLSATVPTIALADNYFDPNLLLNNNDNIDLSNFSKEDYIAPGDYSLSVFVNTEPLGEKTILFKANKEGKVVPVVTIKDLKLFGVNVSAISKLSHLPEDTEIDNIEAYIPNSRITFNINKLTLNASFPQVNMDKSYKGEIPAELLDDGVSAVILNYMANFIKNRTTGDYSSHNNNFFLNLNGGVNIGPWRLRTNYSYNNSSGSDQSSSSDSEFSNTYVMRNIAYLKSMLKIGEITTGGNIFSSIPIKGISLATNQQMLPSSMRGYAPVVRGFANSNATVTIRQNGQIIYKSFVAPGNFIINDISAGGIGGDLEITIEEEDGSKRVYTQAYSSLPIMLREGQFEYEFSAGQYDGGITTDSKKSKFALGTFSYGFNNSITAYGGLLIANGYTSGVIGSGVSLGLLGALSADVTLARTNLDKTYQGQSYRVRYSKSLLSTGTSFDLTALRYSTKDYYNFSDYNNSGYELREGIAPWLSQRQKSSFQTSISQSLGKYGSMYLRGETSRYWGNSRVNNSVTLGYNTVLKGIAFNIDYSISRLKSDDNTWPENRQINFNMNMPLSVFSNASGLQNMNASYLLTHSNDGRTSQQAGLNGSAFDNQLSYGIYQNTDNKADSYSGNMNMSYSGSKGTLSGGYSYGKNRNSFNGSLIGGVVLHSKGVTLSRMLGDSIAIVSADKAKGAEINGNVKIDTFGNAIVPQLSPYDTNSISVNVSTLPDDVTLNETSMKVYPTEGAILARQFQTKVGYQVIFDIKTAENIAIPFGAMASLTDEKDKQANTGIIDAYQSLYMSGLPNDGNVVVTWNNNTGKHSCQFSYSELEKIEVSQQNPIRMVTVNCQ
ncbi:TPA: fimbria/pilus outer membrane usher protein [Proteus mirabilis]|nr:fimbrial biogenesis outer membrane usher protein [Proteus mirabilis]